jgi:hypothetical protein
MLSTRADAENSFELYCASVTPGRIPRVDAFEQSVGTKSTTPFRQTLLHPQESPMVSVAYKIQRLYISLVEAVLDT